MVLLKVVIWLYFSSWDVWATFQLALGQVPRGLTKLSSAMQVSIDGWQSFFIGVFNNLNLWIVAATTTIFWQLLDYFLGVGVFHVFVEDKVLHTSVFVLLSRTLLTIIITWIWLISRFCIIKTIIWLNLIHIFNRLIACEFGTVVVLESDRRIL